MKTMEIDRRGFLRLALAAALVPFATQVSKKWHATTKTAAPMLRPTPVTVGRPVCARCGRPGHVAIEPECPANRETLAALQTTSRREAGSSPGGRV